tara:strand:- start:437 stop:622 length:186 start_codon:yes stop_codon:yes gene_type:complete
MDSLINPSLPSLFNQAKFQLEPSLMMSSFFSTSLLRTTATDLDLVFKGIDSSHFTPSLSLH